VHFPKIDAAIRDPLAGIVGLLREFRERQRDMLIEHEGLWAGASVRLGSKIRIGLFNLAEQWGIRFLDENNLKLRMLSEREEAALLWCCSPYLQDLVTFAINTGLPLGDILNVLIRNRRRILEMPLNDKALSVVTGWHGIRKFDYVFYNQRLAGGGRTCG
jgi:integrase